MSRCFIAILTCLMIFISVGSTRADVVLIPAPLGVNEGLNENNTHIHLFIEHENFTLPINTTVNISAPGSYSITAQLTPAVIPAGTLLNSYCLYYDPVANGPAATTGTVVFGGTILGIIAQTTEWSNSNPTLGAPGTFYGTGELEFNPAQPLVADIVTLDPNTLNLDLHATSSFDPIRVLTTPGEILALPEPTGALALLLPLCAVIRRRRS